MPFPLTIWLEPSMFGLLLLNSFPPATGREYYLFSFHYYLKEYAMKNNAVAKHFILTMSAVLFFGTSPVFASESGHGHAAAAGAKDMSPAETIKMAIEGNISFTEHHDHDSFEAYQKGQTPHLTVITCADSRVHTALFGIDPHNNIFIIRNVGNQIRNSEGSVDYGVRHLPCRILMVTGHSSCGAIKAAMGDYSGETPGIKKELDSLMPVMATDDGKESERIRWGKNVERNVDYQVKQAMELYADKITTGELAVVGAVYDFNDLYGKGRGTLVITNINGDGNPNTIMNSDVLKELSKAEIVTHVGSLAPAM